VTVVTARRRGGREMKCPRCDAELDYDEVDIGVGTMCGNYSCPNCGWSPEDDLPFL
jgi:hypothetical protein